MSAPINDESIAVQILFLDAYTRNCPWNTGLIDSEFHGYFVICLDIFKRGEDCS